MTFRPYTQLTASGISDSRANNTGVTINKATPVGINSSGELDFIDVSDESSVLSIAGVTAVNISNGLNGEFVNSGKVSNITTSAAFGDLIYVSKAGGLTNQKPDVGVGGFLSGDFVVIVGVIAKNSSNPTQKDLVINLERVGQLA